MTITVGGVQVFNNTPKVSFARLKNVDYVLQGEQLEKGSDLNITQGSGNITTGWIFQGYYFNSASQYQEIYKQWLSNCNCDCVCYC